MSPDEPTVRARILSGEVPLDADFLRAVLAVAATTAEPDALLRYALVHRRAFDGALVGAIEEAFLGHALARHATLARSAAALQAHFPDALGHPRAVATVRLALEVDALSSRELFLLMQPLLASAARAEAMLPRASHAPLIDRVRAANVCRGVALATSLIGGLEPVLGDDGVPRFLEVLAALFRDPDPGVGGRAAWAVGALSADDRVGALVEAASARAASGLIARRRFIADVARWQLGELADGPFLDALRDGLGKTDSYARAAALLAMRHGALLSPETTREVVGSFAADPAPVVRAAVIAFAGPPDDERDGVVAALRDLRVAARVGAVGCAGPLAVALEAVERAVSSTSIEVDPASEGLADAALHDTSLLYDASIAVGCGDVEALARAVLARRVASALADDAGSLTAEAARALRRAVDAHPRDRGHAAGAGRYLELSSRLFARAARCDDGALLRPLLSAWAAVAEPIAHDERVLESDIVGAALGLPSARALGHLASSLAGPTAMAVRAMGELAELIEKGAPRGKKAIRAAAMGARVGALAEAVQTLGPPEAPLTLATAGLGRALGATYDAPASGACGVFEVWREALAHLRQAYAESSERLVGAPRVSGRDEAENTHALRSLFAARGLASTDPNRPLFGAGKGQKRVNASLPPALLGLVDAALAAERPPAVASPPRGPVYVGKRVGDYVVERVLGSGAMGHCVVVKRRLEEKDPKARRWVLKVPQRPDLADAFRDEALALIELSKERHPAIVRFVSFVDYGTKLPFLVMELVDGKSLERRVGEGPLGAGEFRAVGAALASGLALAHSRGICHHDVKPANVVLTSHRGEAGGVLVDWGLAGAGVPAAGTPEYMAPERFDQGTDGPLSEAAVGASDVFALGCVLAEMQSGSALVTPTFTADDSAENPSLVSTFAHVAEPFRRWFGCAGVIRNPGMLARRAQVALVGASPGTREVVLACLASSPADRPRATEVKAALEGTA